MKRFALAALVLLAPPLSAAVSTSALTGRVTSGGTAVANATVTAASARLQQPRVTVTGRRGTYWLGALPPGEYEVTFASKGMQTLTRRAVVELARIARADAQLEPSEDEESVTSTATTISVVHDTALTTNRNAASLDRLPVPIDTFAIAYLAPPSYSFFGQIEFDGTSTRVFQDVAQSETVEEMTYIRNVTPIEYSCDGDSAIVVRTRSGGEALSVSVRDTITNNAWLGDAYRLLPRDGAHHFLESASGGRILPNRLWFFGAGWKGARAAGPRDTEGVELKLTAQLGERQNLVATYIDSERAFHVQGTSDTSLASLVHTAQWGPRVLSEITAARASVGDTSGIFPPVRVAENVFSGKASFVAGDHVVSGGVDYETGGPGDARSFFVSDRLWLQRWVVNAGVRYREGPTFGGYVPGGPPPGSDGHFDAQVAAAYDLRGRGRNAVTASARRFSAEFFGTIDEFTAGYVMALGGTGSARLNVIRQDFGDRFAITSLQLDSSYRLFDRFEAGLNYTYSDRDQQGFVAPLFAPNVANAWFSAEIPLGTHALGAMVAYRYFTSPYAPIVSEEDQQAFDVALRYTLPIKRVALTLGADALNLFDQQASFQYPRIVKGWIRIRL